MYTDFSMPTVCVRLANNSSKMYSYICFGTVKHVPKGIQHLLTQNSAEMYRSDDNVGNDRPNTEIGSVTRIFGIDICS